MNREITDSFRVTEEDKRYVRTLKRAAARNK